MRIDRPSCCKMLSTHSRILSSVLLMGTLCTGVPAFANPAETWLQASQGCKSAIEASVPLAVNSLQSVDPTHSGPYQTWPALQFWNIDSVQIVQQMLATGASTPIRMCEVTLLRAELEPQTFMDLVSSEVNRTTKDIASGTHVEAHGGYSGPKQVKIAVNSVEPNTRGCSVLVEFEAVAPPAYILKIAYKERISNDCRAANREEVLE